jgi:hypothetical protein
MGGQTRSRIPSRRHTRSRRKFKRYLDYLEKRGWQKRMVSSQGPRQLSIAPFSRAAARLLRIDA